MKKFYGVIVVALTIVLGIGISYALFSQNLNIGGSAATSGNFNIEFDKTNSKLLSQTGSTGASITVAEDGKTAAVSVPALEYPGSSAEFVVVVKNSGTIDALLEEVTKSGLTDDPNIEVTFSDVSNVNIAGNNGIHTFTLKVSWKQTSQAYSENPVAFTIGLKYSQAI